MRNEKKSRIRKDNFLANDSRYFLAVIAAGSVRAASRKLNVAASAISRQIANLEAEVGIALFDRKGRALALSAAGKILAQGLQAASLAHGEAIEELNALNGLRSGFIRIATVESVSVEVLPRLLQGFSKLYPGICFQVEVAGSDAVTALVRDQKVDLGFTFNPRSLSGLDVVAKQGLRVCAVMHPHHQLASAKSLTLAQCLTHPVAWPSEGLSLRSILDKALGELRLSPFIECNSLRLMSSLAKLGQCIAFQTTIGIEQELRAGTLVALPLKGSAIATDQLMVVIRAGRPARLALEAVVDHIAEHFRGISTVLKK